MRPSVTSLRKRASSTAERAGESGLAAGQDDRSAAPPLGARERGALRRRLRRVRRIRQAMLLELGAFALELQRHGRLEPRVLQRKAAEVAAVDEEARAIVNALDEGRPLSELVAAGVTAPCATCGSLLASADRFCPSCGTPAGSGSNGHRPPAQAGVSAPPPAKADGQTTKVSQREQPTRVSQREQPTKVSDMPPPTGEPLTPPEGAQR